MKRKMSTVTQMMSRMLTLRSIKAEAVQERKYEENEDEARVRRKTVVVWIATFATLAASFGFSFWCTTAGWVRGRFWILCMLEVLLSEGEWRIVEYFTLAYLPELPRDLLLFQEGMFRWAHVVTGLGVRVIARQFIEYDALSERRVSALIPDVMISERLFANDLFIFAWSSVFVELGLMIYESRRAKKLLRRKRRMLRDATTAANNRHAHGHDAKPLALSTKSGRQIGPVLSARKMEECYIPNWPHVLIINSLGVLAAPITPFMPLWTAGCIVVLGTGMGTSIVVQAAWGPPRTSPALTHPSPPTDGAARIETTTSCVPVHSVNTLSEAKRRLPFFHEKHPGYRRDG